MLGVWESIPSSCQSVTLTHEKWMGPQDISTSTPGHIWDLDPGWVQCPWPVTPERTVALTAGARAATTLSWGCRTHANEDPPHTCAQASLRRADGPSGTQASPYWYNLPIALGRGPWAVLQSSWVGRRRLGRTADKWQQGMVRTPQHYLTLHTLSPCSTVPSDFTYKTHIWRQKNTELQGSNHIAKH